MEDLELRERFRNAQLTIVEKFKKNPKCLSAFLVGSMSHDLIWKWSDLEIFLIFDDSYKGPLYFHLMECDVQVVISIKKKSDFKDYLGSTNVSDYFFCALSKSTLLFTKDQTIKEYFEDIFYIGDRDKSVEMLLGFSQAVYYMNKAEKNLYIKRNIDNAIYFLFHLAEGMAWLEVAKNRAIPEREIIAQAKQMNPELFKKIYDPLFCKPITERIIEDTLATCYENLKENTMEVYRPIISYLKTHGTLKDFSMKTREHGFGINYEWLYRVGIVDRYVESVKINNQAEEFFQIGYRIKDNNR